MGGVVEIALGGLAEQGVLRSSGGVCERKGKKGQERAERDFKGPKGFKDLKKRR